MKKFNFLLLVLFFVFQGNIFAQNTLTKEKSIIEISSDDEFKTIMEGNSGKLLVFKLYADWCAPCKILTPTIEKIASQNKSVKFYQVNVDKLPNIAAAFGVSGIPLVVYVRDKKAVWGAAGVRDASEYEAALKL